VEGEQLNRAEQMSYKTIKAEPENATYLDTYAWILFMQKRYAEARIYIDQAMQNDSLQNSVITEHGGDIYIMLGETETALRLWKEAQTKDPGNKTLIRKIKRKKYIR
jgi:predicted Zn-dependent protease